MKKAYEKPNFQRLGSFESMTKAATPGNRDDIGFPTNGPGDEPADMTFS